DEVAQERLKILEFYKMYGERAVIKAFGIKRNTVFVWKKRLKESRNSLASLIPTSTVPKTQRRMTTDPKIVSKIRKLREKYPRLGKDKIKPILNKYCLKEGLIPISISTIGKVIKRNNFFFQKAGRIYHDPSSGWAKNKAKRAKRNRIKYAPKPNAVGYLEMDTILRFVDGIKYYFYCAIDVKGKFAFALPYKHLNSQNTVDFFKKAEYVFPFSIKTVQTDNGLEFLGDFEDYLKKRNILHVFTYPRCCRINGVVERFNRTIQENFIDNNLDIIHSPKLFTSRLIDYLIFYNTERVHDAHGNTKSPMDYLILEGGMSKMSATHTTP
ncbi:DDE-type integrase/transposase/recombinase, partial [Patescibacteria group bacterium]|nr:DDE-type integrase/transposase/recombinase [Patescibacteria group bacterium]